MMRMFFMVLGSLGYLMGASALAAEDGVLPKKAVPMSVTAVRSLYAGKTWEWKSGGAYFAPDRKYNAVSGEGQTLTTGTGRWLVTAKGALCFVADWRERKHLYSKKRTCLYHAKLDGKIYQKKDRSGKWYIFKNAPQQESDEFSRLRVGNSIAEVYDAALKELR